MHIMSIAAVVLAYGLVRAFPTGLAPAAADISGKRHSAQGVPA
jgi:hypothetical protein